MIKELHLEEVDWKLEGAILWRQYTQNGFVSEIFNRA